MGSISHKLCAWCGSIFHKDPRYSSRYWERAKFCGSPCSAKAQSARAAEVRPSLTDAFRAWFTEGDGCWEWQGARDRDGYGIFGYAGKVYRAPAMSLRLDGRPVPRGKYACHHCDNPACIRPSHLYVGRPAENTRDMIRRGRMVRGSQAKNAKVTEADVVAIRNDPRPSSTVAPLYGISASNVQAIRRRQTWKHIA